MSIILSEENKIDIDKSNDCFSIQDDDWNEIVSLNDGLSTLFSLSIPAAKLREENPGNILIVGADCRLFNIIVNKISSEIGKELVFVKDVELLKDPRNFVALLTHASDGTLLAFHGNFLKFIDECMAILGDAMNSNCIDLIIGKGPTANSVHLDLPSAFYVLGTESYDDIPSKLANSVLTVIDLSDVPEASIYKAEIRFFLKKENLSINEAELLRLAYIVPRSDYNTKGIVKYLSDFMLVNNLGNEISGEIIDKAFGEVRKPDEKFPLSISDTDNYSSSEFVESVIILFKKMGYACSAEKSCFFVAERHGMKMGIRALLSDNSAIGVSAVSDIVSDVRHLSLDKGIVITNGIFSAQAYKLARNTHTSLWNRDNLAAIIKEYNGK